MAYMGDKDWWQAQFQRRSGQLLAHEKQIEIDLPYFPSKGTLLDLACGDGRNAIYLAKLGYHVIAVDFCPEALCRLRHFAQAESLQIETMLLDATQADSLCIAAPLDAILINHYRPIPSIYSHLMAQLKADGILWVNGFSQVPLDNPHIKETDIFTAQDFTALSTHTLIDQKHYQINDRHFIRSIWRK